MEEAGAAQVTGDLHKAQRFGIKMLLPSQTMASENETSLQRRKTRRIPRQEFGSSAKILYQEQQQLLDEEMSRASIGGG